MTKEEYDQIRTQFIKDVESVLLEAYKQTGYEWIVCPGTGGLRSISMQNKLYAKGRTEPGDIVTNAKGGSSPHNFDLARDCYPCKVSGQPWFEAPNSLFQTFGKIAETIGLTWGGHFQSIKDWPHVEYRDWRRVRQAWLNKELTFQ